MNRIKELISALALHPHPEGGYYSETYRSAEHIAQHALPARFGGDRSFSTAIYFLLSNNDFSAFHRIKSDECWHFYEGTGLDIFVIDALGKLTIFRLGNQLSKGETFQAVVPAGCWFASKPAVAGGYSLVGCTVSPGFHFLDFEMAKGPELAALYPAYAPLIYNLCRL